MVGLERVLTPTREAREFMPFSSSTMAGGVPTDWPSAPGWYSTVVVDLSSAQEMLDGLERDGHAEKELRILGNAKFEVRWR